MSDSNDWWSGGWRYLKVSHIDADTVPQIISKDSKTLSAMAQEISEIIGSVIKEKDENGIEF